MQPLNLSLMQAAGRYAGDRLELPDFRAQQRVFLLEGY
jgi:hypothetical protein